MLNRTIFKNAASLSVVQILNYAAPLVVMPYVIKTIGLEVFGQVSLALAFASYFGAFVEFGFSLTGVSDIAQNNEEQGNINRIISEIFTVRFGLVGFIILLIGGIISLGLEPTDSNLIWLALTGAIVNSFNITFFFQGIQRMEFLIVFQVISRLTQISLVFLLIEPSNGAWTYLLILMIANFLNAALTIIVGMIKFNMKFVLPSRLGVKKQFFSGLPVYASNLSASLYGANFNIHLIGALSTPSVVGIYALTSKVFLLIGSVGGPVVNSIYPNLASLLRRGDEILRDRFLKIIQFLFFVFLLGAMVTYSLSNLIIDYFADSSNEDAVFLLKLFCLAIPFVPYGSLLTQYLIIKNRKKAIFAVNISIVIINLCLLYVAFWAFTPLVAIGIANLGIHLWICFLLFALFFKGKNYHGR